MAVRRIISNTIDMVEEVTRDAVQVADVTRQSVMRVKNAVGGRPQVSAAAPERVGWQELILDKNALCEQCNEILPRGTSAAVAVYDRPAPPAFLCKGCLKKLGGGDDSPGA